MTKNIITSAFIFLVGFIPGTIFAQDYALAIYGGQLTTDSWERSLVPGAEFANASIILLAGSWMFCKLLEGDLSFEVEIQVGKHFGDQEYWELSLPVIGFRWHRFPWKSYLLTTFAWGIGPSYATDIPEVELIRSDTSKHWLIHWFGEFTFGPPNAVWEILARLQHRSDAFSALGGGSSNALCIGLRYKF